MKVEDILRKKTARVATVRMNVAGREDQHRASLEQLAGIVRENICIAADFVNRPSPAAFADVFAKRGLAARNIGGPDHVMEHEARTDGLARFMSAYARLAKLPPPVLQPVDVGVWIRRVSGLERRLPVQLQPGPEIEIHADPDQLEQLLINLLHNAVDAALETSGGVRVGWGRENGFLEVWVQDDGPGIPNSANLFVPFFTTKPGGSGIGLVLSRQIAEAHGGSLILENRAEKRGCEARLRLPLSV